MGGTSPLFKRFLTICGSGLSGFGSFALGSAWLLSFSPFFHVFTFSMSFMYLNLPIIRPWVRKLSGSSMMGLFSSVLIFHSKVRPSYNYVVYISIPTTDRLSTLVPSQS